MLFQPGVSGWGCIVGAVFCVPNRGEAGGLCSKGLGHLCAHVGRGWCLFGGGVLPRHLGRGVAAEA